jgi:hypothetical protein
MYLDWEEKVIPLDRNEVKSRLLQPDPGIAVGTTSTGLFVNPQTMMPGQEKIVAQRLREVLLPAAG